MAIALQTSVPDVMDLSKEPEDTFKLYGDEAKNPELPANCLLARRLAERDVRFIQLYHPGWIITASSERIPSMPGCGQACYALVTDLKARGLLRTLVVWGGELAAPIIRRANCE